MEARLQELAAGPDRLDAWEAALLEALLAVLESRFAHRLVELLPRRDGMSRAFPSIWAADERGDRIGIVVRHPEVLDEAGIKRDLELLALADPNATYLFIIDAAAAGDLETKLAASGRRILVAAHALGVQPPLKLDHSIASLEAVDRAILESRIELDEAGRYVGEVLLKAHGGRWDTTELGEGVLFPNDEVAFPHAWVKRLARTKAPADRIAAKYAALRATLP